MSSICLALDSPRLDPNSDLAGYLRIANKFFTWYFIFEFAAERRRARAKQHAARRQRFDELHAPPSGGAYDVDVYRGPTAL